MNKKEIICKTKEFVKQKLDGEESGHDWWHTYRVWKLAKKIAKEEKADTFVVELAALLHDLEDYKFVNKKQGLAEKFLKSLNLDENIISQVSYIIENISFSKNVLRKLKTKEAKVVQDADRLDALGAIGIARCFATGAKLGVPIYNPKIKPKINLKNYKGSQTSINHFYEKLLQLEKLMNTKTGKRIAKQRTKFMKQFLKEFFKELALKG
ncbi:MAG: HD domain-containing protein [Nanoarchaeota archaeon]|nr:HD domain-containing protein [Nanoarchaeota archaeon]